MAMSAKAIADMLEGLQATYAATSTALILLNDDEILQLLLKKGYDLGSTVRLGRQDNTYYEGIKLWDSISRDRGDPAFNLNYLGSQIMNLLSWVGDELAENKYFDKSPELELFRHLRNGVSHGNCFSLHKYGEPKRLAKFKGFEVTAALEGKPVFFEFMSTGDVFDLFDHVKANLRSLP